MNLSNYRTSIILGVTFTLLLSTFWFFPDLAFIIFLSLLLQLLLEPAVDFLERRRIPRALAAAIAILAFILVLFAMVSIISRSVVPSFQRFVVELPDIGASMERLPLFADVDFVQEELTNILDRVRSLGAEILGASLSFLFAAFGKVMDFVIIIFVSFYLLKDGEQIKLWLAGLFPHAARVRVIGLFNTLLKALRVYICSQLVMCFITGVVVFAYFKLMGLPYASVFALLSGVSEFIPVLGPTAASALGIIMTASAARELTVQTALFYVALTQVNHNVVYPALVGKSLHLHPVAVILGVVFGGELLGAAGMFLAVPFIVIVKIVITDIYRDQKEQQAGEHCALPK
ncbi:AI-2E family transporter [uncultured Selenomonas sp.]|uniref:AI-2E family transporter n=1 Tax=uncultured Selenomonas sp. TaxID=159275 RepID=UPI0028E75B0A|nr:AI-2E family transporter [uncultured Selenomonas sp.]